MKTVAKVLVKRFLPHHWYRFTPVAPKGYAVNAEQHAILEQYGIRHLEMHVVAGLQAPVQETRWTNGRAENYALDLELPHDVFFLRRVRKGYELRLGPSYARQSPEAVSGWVDAFISTAARRIEWIQSSKQVQLPAQRH
jgi:hypothetical protein